MLVIANEEQLKTAVERYFAQIKAEFQSGNIESGYNDAILTLDKWFKSHKGETLLGEQWEHIQKVAGIISETIRVQEIIGKQGYKFL